VVGAFAYERDKGRFVVFRAKAIVMATGGLGKAFRITSNSWEYTGDGHTLAYDAGADLLDMEFVQFHPTGMVWPPSVRGILVTEGVRGEGGVLRNSEGHRFLFDDIPALYRGQTADSEEEGWRYCSGDPNARRPPELLTRDHVARRILKEVEEGRGSPHGGAFLDIRWLQEKIPNHVEHIKRKIPGMYHQFKELADLDITEEPMEVGPTTHYAMGGIRVDAETQMSTVPGLFAAGECAAGLHGANRLGGKSLSDLLVFGKRAGEHASRFSRDNGAVELDQAQIQASAQAAVLPFECNQESGENPYQIQYDLQDVMQDRVGIIRQGPQLESALGEIERLRNRAENAIAPGSREYNSGWHTSLDLHNLLTAAEAVTRAACAREESRGAHTRDDFPRKDPEWGKVNLVLRKGASGQMEIERVPIPLMTEDLTGIVEEIG
jgi:succinate dehydrogenase / fumarate reductase flavoprotein subunit